MSKKPHEMREDFLRAAVRVPTLMQRWAGLGPDMQEHYAEEMHVLLDRAAWVCEELERVEGERGEERRHPYEDYLTVAASLGREAERQMKLAALNARAEAAEAELATVRRLLADAETERDMDRQRVRELEGEVARLREGVESEAYRAMRAEADRMEVDSLKTLSDMADVVWQASAESLERENQRLRAAVEELRPTATMLEHAAGEGERTGLLVLKPSAAREIAALIRAALEPAAKGE